MASKHLLVLVLFVIGATITQATMPVTIPISNVTDPKIQYIGSFAVDEYNKLGQSHLIFKEVIGGHVFFYPPSAAVDYYVDLMAINCSHSGALGNYTAQVLEVSSIKTYYFKELKPKQT
ncbi:Cysteine proteinase inhibitor 5 [Carex littledalei]|uniref:Cysteine proteinase inhibitor 5 n=1 Tax=Carex littledalei TaxID=544730 RepID=A0A833REH2_9POAL|nr:Cysteine proteinase inhibitor 5 [Carex littledalei]